MIEFKVITPSELTEDDIANIEKAIAADCLGQRLDNVINTVLADKAIMWRWTADKGTGIMITQEYRGTKERELFVWYIGGKGVQAHGHYVSNVLEEFCRIRGLKRISAVIKTPMIRFLSRFGYSVDRYLISKEVSDGRHAVGHHSENDSRDTGVL